MISSRLRRSRAAIIVVMLACPSLVIAQTQIVPPPNSYTPAQDVEMGRQAAAEARKTLPLMRRQRAVLCAGPLRRFDHGAVDEHRSARQREGVDLLTDGEVAGVMAHELSHVLLRHGTAQASKATKYEAGQIAGAVLGAIIGGGWGQVISQGTQFGLGSATTRIPAIVPPTFHVRPSRFALRTQSATRPSSFRCKRT
jgi:hypothetical protein